MGETLKLDYVEFYAAELEREQAFMAGAFGWDFVAYGADYRDIRGAGLGGGIERVVGGGPDMVPLVVLRADDLVAALAQVRGSGARITRDIFAFPGGERFEFVTPGGTKMAVWSVSAN